MPLQFETRDDGLALEGELNVFEIQGAQGRLVAAQAAAPALVLDLRGVTEFDTAGLQLLLLLAHRATRDGRELSLLAPSAAIRDAFELCQARALQALVREAA